MNVKKKIKKRKRKGFEIKTKCELFRFIYIYIATNAMKFECSKVRKVKKKRYRDECSKNLKVRRL